MFWLRLSVEVKKIQELVEEDNEFRWGTMAGQFSHSCFYFSLGGGGRGQIEMYSDE